MSQQPSTAKAKIYIQVAKIYSSSIALSFPHPLNLQRKAPFFHCITAKVEAQKKKDMTGMHPQTAARAENSP